MRFSEIFTLVACLATTAMAGADDVAPKASPEVLVCEHVGFGGQCRYLKAPLGVCQNVPADLNHKVSSVGPNQAAGVCRFYDDFNCAGNSFISAFPGVGDIVSVYPAFNDKIISFKCTSI
ncbi:uncharacterized protein Triagg1_2641 [Trichoderma aggressivum f. europaeum]|uniref:SSCRP protein n=1 Tax=Trichoderma aggressivum f. europaeum TaxID=173218 RepID=A0AAE1IK72_9HYPO|nr:hypothetical protein Triagg1_2641 [Trichoderma aggressivum f. europaeum]